MSNMYVTEPATEGKVLLHTSFGDLDVELWPQQAPKACRNFVQLCLEGYYDNTIFHRIIKDFMVQGGDPTGTGTGGESIYSEPFIDEFHSRLKFNHRGIVAMANENKPNSNHAQFFFTLDACEFLNRKHTIFGKITGNTIFNLLSVSDLDTDANDRPLSPPKLLSAEVLWNPFDDMVARKTTKRVPEESATAKKKRERKATKDRKLLSFGDEEDAFDDGEAVSRKKKTKKKMMSSHDLLNDTKLKAEVDQEIAQKIAETAKKDTGRTDASRGDKDTTTQMDARARLKAAVAAASVGKAATEANAETIEDVPADIDHDEKKKKRKAEVTDERDEYTRLREELKRDKKAAAVLLGQKAREQEDAKAKSDVLTPLQQQRAKFLERKKAANRSGRQQDTLKKLAQFKATLLGVNEELSTKLHTDDTTEAYHGQVLEDVEDGNNEDAVAKDKSWMAAKLKFKKHIDDQFRNNYGPSVDDYTTVDTRTEREKTKPDAGRTRNRDRRERPGDSRKRSRDRSRSADRSRDRSRSADRSREQSRGSRRERSRSRDRKRRQ